MERHKVLSKGELSLSVWTNVDKDELNFCLNDVNYTVPHSGFHRCCVHKTSSQVIDGNTWTDLTWDSIYLNIGDLHNDFINNERITIKTKGKYRFIYKIEIDSDDKFAYQGRVYKNGDTPVLNTVVKGVGSKDSSELTLLGISPEISFEVGDYITLQVFHNNSTSQQVRPANSFFATERVY